MEILDSHWMDFHSILSLSKFQIFVEKIQISLNLTRISFAVHKHILITVQRDATQSSLFITLQVHSTCYGCQPHPSLGVHKTVTTASKVAKLAWPCWREVAAQKI